MDLDPAKPTQVQVILAAMMKVGNSINDGALQHAVAPEVPSASLQAVMSNLRMHGIVDTDRSGDAMVHKIINLEWARGKIKDANLPRPQRVAGPSRDELREGLPMPGQVVKNVAGAMNEGLRRTVEDEKNGRGRCPVTMVDPATVPPSLVKSVKKGQASLNAPVHQPKFTPAPPQQEPMLGDRPVPKLSGVVPREKPADLPPIPKFAGHVADLRTPTGPRTEVDRKETRLDNPRYAVNDRGELTIDGAAETLVIPASAWAKMARMLSRLEGMFAG